MQRSTQSARVASHTIRTSLIQTSADELRRGWIRSFKEIERKLEKAKHEWNEFESNARSQFQTWYYSTFPDEVTRLREIEEKSNEIRNALEAVQAQIRVNGLTRAKAFQWVSQAIREKRDPFPTDAEYANDRQRQNQAFHEDFEKRMNPEGTRTLDHDLLESLRDSVVQEAISRFGFPQNSQDEHWLDGWIDRQIMSRYEGTTSTESREEARGQIDEEEAEAFFRELFEKESPEESSLEVQVEEVDFKGVYRQIVRLLHPDRGTEMSETEKEFWSQTQDAYRLRDLEALRTILFRIEGGGKIDVNQIESIGRIQELAMRLRREYLKIDVMRSQVKKTPIYRFWASKRRPTNRKKLEVQIRIEIKNQIFALEQEWRALSRQWKRFER